MFPMKETAHSKEWRFMRRTLKFFTIAFAFLFFAAAPQLKAQEAVPRDQPRTTPQQGRPPQAEPRNAPAQNSDLSYSDFYKEVYNRCNETVRSVGEEQGHPQGPQCETVLQACLNTSFVCLKKNAQCEIKTLPDGTRGIHCEKSTNECRGEITEFVFTQIVSHPNECGAVGPDLSAPGCGNQVTEIGEDCDAGTENGKPDSSCNAQCRKPGTPPVCGNSVTEEGEECDAGTENGKQSSGCDIECKKFVVANGNQNTGTPSAMSPSPTTAASGCAMTGGAGRTGSFTTLFIMALGTLLGFRFRERLC